MRKGARGNPQSSQGAACRQLVKFPNYQIYPNDRKEHNREAKSAKDIELTNDAPVALHAGIVDAPDGVVRIKQFNHGARTLISIRHPVDRMLSDYKMQIRHGRERREFWPSIGNDGALNTYVRRSLYADGIARFRDSFEHVLVLRAEDDDRMNVYRLFGFSKFATPMQFVSRQIRRYGISIHRGPKVRRRTLILRQGDCMMQLSKIERNNPFTEYFAENRQSVQKEKTSCRWFPDQRPCRFGRYESAGCGFIVSMEMLILCSGQTRTTIAVFMLSIGPA